VQADRLPGATQRGLSTCRVAGGLVGAVAF